MTTENQGEFEGVTKDEGLSAESTGADESAPKADASIARVLTAENQVKNYVIASVAASVVPVPLFDIVAVTAIQLRMIQKVSELYGRPFSERAGRNIITALAGGALGYGVGATAAASMAKLIPGIGWMVGMASLPVVAGATTYAIGRVFIKHYEEGGSMFDMSADTLRAYYKEQFEKGKQLAAQVKAKATPVKKEGADAQEAAQTT